MVAMPFKSLAQDRWGHTKAGMKALGGPQKVAEWDSATRGLSIPPRKSPTGGLLGPSKRLSRKSGK